MTTGRRRKIQCLNEVARKKISMPPPPWAVLIYLMPRGERTFFPPQEESLHNEWGDMARLHSPSKAGGLGCCCQTQGRSRAEQHANLRAVQSAYRLSPLPRAIQKLRLSKHQFPTLNSQLPSFFFFEMINVNVPFPEDITKVHKSKALIPKLDINRSPSQPRPSLLSWTCLLSLPFILSIFKGNYCQFPETTCAFSSPRLILMGKSFPHQLYLSLPSTSRPPLYGNLPMFQVECPRPSISNQQHLDPTMSQSVQQPGVAW